MACYDKVHDRHRPPLQQPDPPIADHGQPGAGREGEKLSKVGLAALGRRPAADGRGDPGNPEGRTGRRPPRAQPPPVARTGLGPEDRRRSPAHGAERAADRAVVAFRDGAHGRSRRLGGGRQPRPCRRALPAPRSAASRRRRRLGAKPAPLDAARRPRLHPALDTRRPRPGADAGLGGEPCRRSRVVHPEGDRLVAARALQARSRPRPPLPRRARRYAEGRGASRSVEISSSGRGSASPDRAASRRAHDHERAGSRRDLQVRDP